MAVSIDPRPTVFGDRYVVTGTYAATDTTIDLSAQLSSIDMCVLTPTAEPSAVTVTTTPPADLNIADVVQVDGTTVTIHNGDDANSGASVAGTFMAMGRRA
jgi:hypothetical protein